MRHIYMRRNDLGLGVMNTFLFILRYIREMKGNSSGFLKVWAEKR